MAVEIRIRADRYEDNRGFVDERQFHKRSFYSGIERSKAKFQYYPALFMKLLLRRRIRACLLRTHVFHARAPSGSAIHCAAFVFHVGRGFSPDTLLRLSTYNASELKLRPTWFSRFSKYAGPGFTGFGTVSEAPTRMLCRFLAGFETAEDAFFFFCSSRAISPTPDRFGNIQQYKNVAIWQAGISADEQVFDGAPAKNLRQRGFEL